MPALQQEDQIQRHFPAVVSVNALERLSRVFRKINTADTDVGEMTNIYFKLQLLSSCEK